MIIAPSLLSADFAYLSQEVADVEKSGADWLHLDVMDGQFVPNITFGAGLIKALRPHSNLFFDVHLMIEAPERYIADFAQSGADLITVHVEATKHLHRAIQTIKSYHLKAAVALNPATSLAAIEEILPEIDMVLLMSVNPGFGGQQFIDITAKIRRLKALCTAYQLHPYIQIDGGITVETAPQAIAAGADVLVAGSAIFGHKNRQAAIETIRQSVMMKEV